MTVISKQIGTLQEASNRQLKLADRYAKEVSLRFDNYESWLKIVSDYQIGRLRGESPVAPPEFQLK